MKLAPEFTDSIVIKLGSGLGVATWFCLRLPSWGPGSNPKLLFFQFILLKLKLYF